MRDFLYRGRGDAGWGFSSLILRPQQLRQLGDIGCDASGLVPSEQVGCGAKATPKWSASRSRLIWRTVFNRHSPQRAALDARFRGHEQKVGSKSIPAPSREERVRTSRI